MAKMNAAPVMLSGRWATGLAVAAAVGFIGGGFALGVLAVGGPSGSSETAATATGAKAAAKPSTTPSTTATTSTGPFTVGQSFNFQTPVESLAGQTTTLAQGTKATVVLTMASWCLYCAYEDKWVMPDLAKTPGVVVDIVDVSPQGGIGDPGPQSPAFSGHDGTGGSLTVAQMVTTMQEYKKTFGTLNAANVHVYVAPSATRTAWNVQSFPTMGFMSGAGIVKVAPDGAQTLSQAQADLQQADA